MRVLILPGYGNSGPDHWQSRWQARNPAWTRFAPSAWEQGAQCGDWLAALDRAVAADPEPPLLVAHSLSCLLVGHWGATRQTPVRGAFLVAPPDPAAAAYPADALGFAPVPRGRLPFPALVIASTDDPYGTAAFARDLAEGYGAGFLALGPRGHINSASGHGDWPEGQTLLTAFRAGVFRRDAPVRIEMPQGA